MHLKKWKDNSDLGTIVESFLIYYHGHGTYVGDTPCLLTPKMTAVPFEELVNDVLEAGIHVNNFYLVLDCCSDHEYVADETARQRVEQAAKKRKHIFKDKVTTISAAPAS